MLNCKAKEGKLHADTLKHNWSTIAVTAAMTTLTGGHTVLNIFPKDVAQYLVCASATDFP